jgi:hypothetical protein
LQLVSRSSFRSCDTRHHGASNMEQLWQWSSCMLISKSETQKLRSLQAWKFHDGTTFIQFKI